MIPVCKSGNTYRYAHEYADGACARCGHPEPVRISTVPPLPPLADGDAQRIVVGRPRGRPRKIDEQQEAEIRAAIARGEPIKQIARRHGIAPSTVRARRQAAQ